MKLAPAECAWWKSRGVTTNILRLTCFRGHGGYNQFTCSERGQKGNVRTFSDHNLECPTCIRNLNCELQKLSEELGVKSIRYPGEKSKAQYDDFHLL